MAHKVSTKEKIYKKQAHRFVLQLLTLGIILLLGYVGWHIYKSKNDLLTYDDSARQFSFMYPATWKLNYPVEGGHDGQSPSTPDYTKVSRPVTIAPQHGQKDNNVQITPGCMTVSSTGQSISVTDQLQQAKDKYHTQEDMTINGYQALYDKTDFNTAAESYVDHTYAITNDDDCVTFRYRESWHHDMSGTNFDDSKNVADFKRIVQSIKFAE